MDERWNDVRGVVFDLDGTLIDSYEAITESLNAALVSLDCEPLELAEARSMVGRGLEVLIEKALASQGVERPGRLVPAGVERFRSHYDHICVEKTTLLPGVATTLSTLDRRGYRMAVATNKPSNFARRLLDALGVGRILDPILGPDSVGRPKPDPEMVLTALRRMGLARTETIYVGDMEIDVQTARAAGLSVVVMPTGSTDLKSLRGAGADLVLDRFDRLLDHLPGPGRSEGPGGSPY